MPTFPNLVGLGATEAEGAYAAAGFTGNGYASYTHQSPYTNVVESQSPDAGTSQDAATDAQLVIDSISGNGMIWGS